MTRLLALGALALLLASCGKVGPIRPPGPADQVTWPRAYPAPERPPEGSAAPR